MTLVIGVKCKRGVVMVADSAATFGSMGTRTIAQPTAEKIRVVDARALVAVSGPVGLGQRLSQSLADSIKSPKFLKRSSSAVMTDLSNEFRKHTIPEIKVAIETRGLVGPDIAGAPALSTTLVALAINGEPCLFEFDHQSAPEEMVESLPFSCIGSGKQLADPYMAFFKNLFWPNDELPSMAQGEFTALWAMRQAIDFAPGGIADPVHLFRLDGNGTKFTAHKMPDEHLQEHMESIGALSEVMKNWNRGESAGLRPEVPSPDTDVE